MTCSMRCFRHHCHRERESYSSNCRTIVGFNLTKYFLAFVLSEMILKIEEYEFQFMQKQEPCVDESSATTENEFERLCSLSF